MVLKTAAVTIPARIVFLCREMGNGAIADIKIVINFEVAFSELVNQNKFIATEIELFLLYIRGCVSILKTAILG